MGKRNIVQDSNHTEKKYMHDCNIKKVIAKNIYENCQFSKMCQVGYFNGKQDIHKIGAANVSLYQFMRNCVHMCAQMLTVY